MAHNVRRYVQLAQSRGGTCFCRLTVVLGYTLRLQIYRVGKNRDTSGGPRREPGQPAPPFKVFHADHNILAVQKPIAYTDLLVAVCFGIFGNLPI
jgi:hypothetical protein